MNITTAHLEKFVVDCKPKLNSINTALNAFNIFNVLGVQYREIRHSNFLGWLFDPNESHQLGDVFLKGLFKIIEDAMVFDSKEYDALLLKDVSKTIVYRESVHNIDILIVNKEFGLVITIENKIHSGYLENQLSKYHDYVESNYSEFGKRIYLTLTPKKSDSHKEFNKGDNYTNINYQNITELLEAKRLIIDSSLPTVKESINQYISMVQKDITKTSKEVALAKEIYKNYKKEIDFIISNQENFAIYKDEILSFIIDGNIEGISISHDSGSKNAIYLLPTDEKLLDLFRHPEAKSRGGNYIFSLVLFLEKDAIWLKFGYGNIDECENKLEIQAKKEKQFEVMKKFKCFKNSKLNIDFHDNDGAKNYAAICGVPLFNDDIYFDNNKSVLELFSEKFEEINKELIQPWVVECLEKLS